MEKIGINAISALQGKDTEHVLKLPADSLVIDQRMSIKYSCLLQNKRPLPG